MTTWKWGSFFLFFFNFLLPWHEKIVFPLYATQQKGISFLLLQNETYKTSNIKKRRKKKKKMRKSFSWFPSFQCVCMCVKKWFIVSLLHSNKKKCPFFLHFSTDKTFEYYFFYVLCFCFCFLFLIEKNLNKNKKNKKESFAEFIMYIIQGMNHKSNNFISMLKEFY